jgi:hypothetical protein
MVEVEARLAAQNIRTIYRDTLENTKGTRDLKVVGLKTRTHDDRGTEAAAGLGHY